MLCGILLKNNKALEIYPDKTDTYVANTKTIKNVLLGTKHFLWLLYLQHRCLFLVNMFKKNIIAG